MKHEPFKVGNRVRVRQDAAIAATLRDQFGVVIRIVTDDPQTCEVKLYLDGSTVILPSSAIDLKRVYHKSMIGLFEKCPVAYEFRYVDGLRIPPGSAAIIGTGAHVSAAADLTAKRDAGSLLPDDAIADLARDSTNTAWDREGVYLSPQERFLGEKKARGEAVDEAIGLAQLHHRKLAPSLAPKHIERPFTIELNDFPVDLSGTIDLQTVDGGLRDLKTRKASPPSDFADYCMDLSCYGLAAKALDGQEPTAMFMDFLVKTKTPKLVTLQGHRTEGAYRAFLLRLEAVSHAIESGSFPPCSPESWMCSPTWCGYFDKCPYGKAARVTI